MKTWTAMALCLAGVLVLGTGCNALGPNKEQTAAMVDAYRVFAAQQRMGNVIEVKGTADKPAVLNVSGETITIATPLPPLEVLPPVGDRQYDTIQHVATELSRLGMFAAGAYFLKDAIGADRTTNTTTTTTP